VAVGLDYIGDQARAHGWEQGSGRSLPELLALWADEPIGAVVATSIARDGMLEGPDLAGLRTLLSLTPHPVIASGGVATLEDLRALADLGTAGGPRLAGAIVGKALVEGRFSVEEAVAACTASV
jgi:phosphoribosylformimino-5-aminoimidazole carboxamide ribonucleotide (ProFAR) isomerase